MATRLLERTDEYTKLRERQEALKAKELVLRKEWLAAEGGKDARKAQLEISTKLRATTAELLSLGPLIAESKAVARVAGLEALMGDPGYKKAAITAAAALAAQLGPWLPLADATYQARKAAIAAPQLPRAIGQMFIEAKVWLASMIRAGALDEAHLPAPLKILVKENGQ